MSRVHDLHPSIHIPLLASDTSLRVALARCTPEAPDVWPSKDTRVAIVVEVLNGSEWTEWLVLTSEGGLAYLDEEQTKVCAETSLYFALPEPKPDAVKVRLDVENGPPVSRGTVELIGG
jgi:hypothetical protein